MKYLQKIYLLLLLCLVTGSRLVHAQVKAVPEAQVKAAYVYNFLKFVYWPDESFSSPGASFVIGVTENDAFTAYLKEIVNGEKMGAHPIVVREITDQQGAASCHLIYSATADPVKIRQLLSSIDDKKVLTVGTNPGFLKSGGMITLARESNRVKVEINLRAVRGSQLQVSSKLLSVARLYNSQNNR